MRAAQDRESWCTLGLELYPAVDKEADMNYGKFLKNYKYNKTTNKKLRLKIFLFSNFFWRKNRKLK